MTEIKERLQTPEHMLFAVKAEMDSLKAEEKALRKQLSSFKEEFQLLVRSAAELYPEILDDEFPQKVAARQQLQMSPNISPWSPETGTTRTPRTRGNYRSHDTQHRRPMFELKRYPPRNARLNSEETVAQIQEQFENNAAASSGIDARKIRSSLPNSPTDDIVPSEPSQGNSLDDERTSRLKKKMIKSRTVDVVNLGLF